jgi:hypothetical protein
VARMMARQGVWISPTVNRGWQRYLDNPDPTKLQRIRTRSRPCPPRHPIRRYNGCRYSRRVPSSPGRGARCLPADWRVFSRRSPPRRHLESGAGARARDGQCLEPDFAADVLVVDGNPTADMWALTRPVAVSAGGRPARLPADPRCTLSTYLPLDSGAATGSTCKVIR